MTGHHGCALVVSFPAAGAGPDSLGWARDLAGDDGEAYLALSNASSVDDLTGGRWRSDTVEAIRSAADRCEARVIALVGHSMGGLSAVSVSEDVGTGAGLPVAVLALNTPCPDERGLIPTLSDCSDREIAAVLGGSGIGSDVVDDPDLLAEVADDVRCDARVADRLALDLGSLDRIRDLHLVTARDDRFIGGDRCAAWRDRVTGTFRLESVPGTHMLIDTPRGSLTTALGAVLTSLRTAP